MNLKLPLPVDHPVIVTLNWLIQRAEDEIRMNQSFLREKVLYYLDGTPNSEPQAPFRSNPIHQEDAFLANHTPTHWHHIRDVELIEQICSDIKIAAKRLEEYRRFKLHLYKDVDFGSGDRIVTELKKALDVSARRALQTVDDSASREPDQIYARVFAAYPDLFKLAGKNSTWDEKYRLFMSAAMRMYKLDDRNTKPEIQIKLRDYYLEKHPRPVIPREIKSS